MLTINLQNPAAVSAFVMSADFARREVANAVSAKWRLEHPDRVRASNDLYRSTRRVTFVPGPFLVRINLVPVRQVCVKCGAPKVMSEFNLRGDGLPQRICRECQKAASKLYYYSNPEKRFAYREKHRIIARASYARATPERKERIKQRRERWLQESPEVMHALRVQRRALELFAPGFCSAEQLKARFEFYGDRCAYCGAPAESADHVIALSRGGSNWPANIRPCCTPCNSSKRNKTLSVWKAERSTA